jgi:hypothetical protein
MAKNKIEKFDEWYYGYFLASRDPTSPILVGENKQVQAKFARIGVVCKFILIYPEFSLQEMRKKIAKELFVSMRCALDYINYAKLVLEEWKK